jgi:hypothetical protein
MSTKKGDGMNRIVKRIAQFAACVSAAVFGITTLGLTQAPDPQQANAYYEVEPWTGGTTNDALFQANSGKTIPMSPYSVDSPLRGHFTGVTVGGSGTGYSGPPSPVIIDAVVIPVIVQIFSQNGSLAIFDPTKPNSCDGGSSAEYRFRNSPLVVDSNLHFNGVDVGSVQYIDGFMKAQFWHLEGNLPAYSNHINWSFAKAVTAGTVGLTEVAKCGQLGVISKASWVSETNLLISYLQSNGIISPTKFAVFLLENVVTSGNNPPTFPANCCTLGRHGSTGSPVQTYAWMEYDTSGLFSGAHDISVSTHEVGEWMSDPLGTNATPAWGNIGQVSGCSKVYEVGDPLSGTEMPVMHLNGYDYHAQELAFFSWFFFANGASSVGAGKKFSGNGTFDGPSKDCPPGGTH